MGSVLTNLFWEAERFFWQRLSVLVRGHIRGVEVVGRDDSLEVLGESKNFLSIDKPSDLVVNSDDPQRNSAYRMLARMRPEMADFGKLKVRSETHANDAHTVN